MKSLLLEHHHGLTLCWRIRTGLLNGTEPERIKKYAIWFYDNHLVPHFDVEEKYLFPVMGSGNKYVKQAISEHKRLRVLFKFKGNLSQTLELIVTELDHHIRFEEKVLFPKIKKKANAEQLQLLKDIHDEVMDPDHLDDIFWEQND